jgi:hypothetical protein
MNVQKTIHKALKNPEVNLVLEVSARAREIEQREPATELTPSTGLGVNPTTAQAIMGSGQVLHNERELVP